MDITEKITVRSLQKNKKRTIVTIVGIILASALITAVAGMAESFRASMIAYEKANSGDYHYRFSEVSRENRKFFENNRNIQSMGYEADLGYAQLMGSENPDKPYLCIKALDKNAMEAVPIKLISGRLPENAGEILISEHIRTNGGVEMSVGDRLSLTLGYRDDKEGGILSQTNPFLYEEETFVPREEKTYTIVGIMERPNNRVEERMAPGYTVITCLEEPDEMELVTVYATYTKEALHNREEVTSSLSEAFGDWYCNVYLIKWETLDFSGRTMVMLYSMAAVALVIIIAASVFCIHNSFQISLTEKTKLYGMLSSVGTTKRQRKKMVYAEAAFFGVIGIPLGILSGLLADFIIVKVTSGLLMTSMGIELVYVVSVPAVIMGIFLSSVTIFLSAQRVAQKAGKLSPIWAIRGNETVKMKAGKLHCPRFIHALFGVGGQIAWKNLRRARTKYRTTVVSIVVSVAVFIAMTAFIRLAFRASFVYYEDAGYQICVRLYGEDQNRRALKIAGQDGVKYAEIQRMLMSLEVDTDTLPYNERYLNEVIHNSSNASAIGISIIALGKDAYARYCGQVGVSVEDAEDKGILIADYNSTVIDKQGKERHVIGMMYDYRPGDVITGLLRKGAGNETLSEETLSIELIAQTDIRPTCVKYYGGIGILVVSDEWLDKYQEYQVGDTVLYIECEDADKLETTIRDIFATDISILNEDREYQREKSLYLLISIFLYGFIVVIALIGITNIFNTITTNMELRAREFAMLKSIGMTKKEFVRMIRLESLFYGMKALIIGIPLGTLCAFFFHRAMAGGIEMEFRLPYEGMLISIAAVALLLFGIMRYSMAKINRKNIIETIQNENI